MNNLDTDIDKYLQAQGINNFFHRLSIAIKSSSVYTVAEASNISRSTLYQYLNEASYPDIARLAAIAENTGYSISWLLFGDKIMKKPLLKLEAFLQYIDSAFLALFAAISIQIIVFVLWTYGVLTNHTLDELNTNSLAEWHQGIKTMWYASWNVTAAILLCLVIYISLRLYIKKMSSK